MGLSDKDVEALVSFCLSLSTSTSVDGGGHSLLTQLQRRFEARCGLVWARDSNEHGLVLRDKVGDFPPAAEKLRIRLDESVIGEIVANRRPTILSPGTVNPSDPVFALLGSDGSALCVPLGCNNQVHGVMLLLRWSPWSLTETDLLWLTLLGAQLAAAYEFESVRSRSQAQANVYASLLDSIPSSLVVLDRGLRVVSVNHNFVEKARRDERSTLGHRIEDVMPHVLVDAMHLSEKIQKVFLAGVGLEGGKVTYRAPGLPTRMYYYRLIPLRARDEGGVENVALLMDDITEREQLGEEVRRVERHLASVVECANDLVVSLDPDGNIVTWNQAAERASGLTMEEVRGRSLLSLCASDEQAVMSDMLAQLRRGKHVHNTEVDLITAEGQRVSISWSCSPMRYNTEQITAFVAVGRDLTEHRQLEAQLIRSAKMASLGVMAGGIAHELRNPLSIISVSAQLMLEQKDEQLSTECAERIYRATERASLIIESLLKFARLQQHSTEPMDVGACIEDTIALLSDQLLLKKIRRKVDVRTGLVVNGNAGLMQQAFTNLILNACNALSDGGFLRISARQSSDKEIELQFEDNGHGISQEDLPRIFDPFFTRMPVGKGTGLGMAITYRIIEYHHGTIDVQSEVGKGTVFTIRLPVIVTRPRRAVNSAAT